MLRRLVSRILSRIGEVLFSSISRGNDEREARLTNQLDQLSRKIDAASILTEQMTLMRPESPGSPLSDFGYSVFSQFGEDGILRELLERIPALERSFVEFGVEDYSEANTRLLAESGRWRGLVIDGSSQNVDSIRRRDLYWRTNMTAVAEFVTAENINQILRDAGFQGEVGVLSIDIDGNDYWVWQAIDVILPQVVICEFNSIFGRNHAVTIPYRSDFSRNVAHRSNLYFGASLLALGHLAASKGYFLAAVEPSGVNAFFVRSSIHATIEPLDPRNAFQLTPVRESLDQDGHLSFLTGRERLDAIADLPVVLIPAGDSVKLGDLNIEY